VTRDHGSRARLGRRDLVHYAGDTLFDRIARAVCEAECLPRKELYEAWEVARRVRRRVRGGRVVDLAAGHGLVAHLMLVLDDTSPEALAVDVNTPPSAAKLSAALLATWPRLAGRVQRVSAPIDEVALREGDVLVSVHACGALTDRVLDRAIAHRCTVAVLPCCHDVRESDTGGLEGWMSGPLAVDATRAARLRAEGFEVRTQEIPDDITPKNRLLIAAPLDPRPG
jgi:hypothetical protein